MRVTASIVLGMLILIAGTNLAAAEMCITELTGDTIVTAGTAGYWQVNTIQADGELTWRAWWLSGDDLGCGSLSSCGYLFTDSGSYTVMVESQYAGEICYSWLEVQVYPAEDDTIVNATYIPVSPYVNEDYEVEVTARYDAISTEIYMCGDTERTFYPLAKIITSHGYEGPWVPMGTSPGTLTNRLPVTATGVAGDYIVTVLAAYEVHSTSSQWDCSHCPPGECALIPPPCAVACEYTVQPVSPPEDNIIGNHTGTITIQDNLVCGGPEPDCGATGVICGPSQAAYSGQLWQYTAYAENSCEWECAAGYSRNDMTCWEDCAAGIDNNELTGACCPSNFPVWNSSLESCTNPEYTCGGTEPTGDGIAAKGPDTYTGSHTPTSWTHTAGSPSSCEYRCATGYEPGGTGCVLSPVCNSADPCCNSEGQYETAGTVCGQGSWTCSGSGSPNTCSRQRPVYTCTGSSAACNVQTSTQTQNAPAGQVCSGGNFVTVSSSNYCGSTGRDACEGNNAVGYRMACGGSGTCTVTSAVSYTIQACTGQEDHMCLDGYCVDACWTIAISGDWGADNNQNSLHDSQESVCSPMCSYSNCQAEGYDTGGSCSAGAPSDPSVDYSVVGGLACTQGPSYSCYCANCPAGSEWSESQGRCVETACHDGIDNNRDGTADVGGVDTTNDGTPDIPASADCIGEDQPPQIIAFELTSTFDPDTTTIVPYETVEFYFRIQDDSPWVSYELDFGDGTPTYGPHSGWQNIEDWSGPKQYTSIGTYFATLTATDSVGQQAQQTLQVNTVGNTNPGGTPAPNPSLVKPCRAVTITECAMATAVIMCA
jgi:hypothetical protein